MSDSPLIKEGETFAIFAIPEAKREPALRAINAINDLGGELLTMAGDAGVGGTVSGTMCTFSTGAPGGQGDYVCTDSDT